MYCMYMYMYIHVYIHCEVVMEGVEEVGLGVGRLVEEGEEL